jgi:hypothetical protein
LTLLFVYFVNRSLSAREVALIFDSLRPAHVAGAVLLGMGGLWCQAKRWEIILRYERFAVTPPQAWKTLLAGNLFAFVTPGRVGELFRGMAIAPGRKADAVFAVIVDKLFIVATVLLVGLTMASWQTVVRGVALPFRPIAPVGAAVMACLIAVPLVVRRPDSLRAHPWMRYVVRLVKMTPRAFTRAGGVALGCSFGAHALLLAQTVLLLLMFGVNSAGDALLVAGQAYALMAVVPLFIGNMGIREYSFALFLGQLDAGAAGDTQVRIAAVGASAVVLVMNLIVPALAGLVWTVIDNRK